MAAPQRDAAAMGAGWRIVAERVADLDEAGRERLRVHLADGEARPALVVRLDPLVLACPGSGAEPVLLLVDHPHDSELIRRRHLRMGSRLTAIANEGLFALGDLFGEGATAQADESAWHALQETSDTLVRTSGWLVRNANPLASDPLAEPLDRVAAPRQVVVIDSGSAPIRRRWGYLAMGIVLVILLKLLLVAIRH